ncbi:DUF4097 family beta strand repeat-containing protein [Heyndrickxia oleronia]|uniref:DUF4097 family beta strand repeat-containing protein n=1 Tax=Heyndrickxia oleronia TaxID=38875 RepID=A0A8E2LEN3_9BACI|nr:DUF4097 family beta strand repeat-containing protein [Heyndrickxia oleronia]MCI1590239.1 DUF4097 domain-containing protein [Heyndrickxia oleronia]MCI1614021.1 DUF4097 domain-containing protein [Heyndrickxia oleronia]MCI1744327.1 DUF4097 domain-containing protein [Heyndrickxia oleronia]MCI1761883.1 DUF4097 domain-containing protein [Heyndrickxia oleronia]MDH5163665.1 DUF4097 family beta strand repeat-containing protein [Heyndrickxia oleronia]
MNKYYICLLMVGILFLSACSSNEQEDLQTVAIKGIENLNIDHGSTTLVVESADIESFQASWLNSDGPGIVIHEEKGAINIRLKSDFKEIVNIGKMPQLSVRIPIDYEGKVSINGSSGNANIKNLYTKKLNIKGKSGNVSLDYLEINNDIDVSVKSGNILLNLDNKDSNIHWLLQSGSGRRSVAIPMENRQQSNRKTQGQTGDGSFNVQLQTTSGNITIK